MSGAPVATLGSDTSGNKSSFESRSNTARTPGDAKALAPAADASAKKTFNESRSNSTRTTSPIVNNGTGRTLGGAATADDAAAQGAGTANTPKSNL